MKPVRLATTVLPKVGAFAFVLKEDRADCQPGVPLLARNGRFVITRRTLLPSGELELTLLRDRSTRRQRHGASTTKTLVTNTQYDLLRKKP